MGLFDRFKKKSESVRIELANTGNGNIAVLPESLENSSFWSCVVNLSRIYATLPLHAYAVDRKGNSEMMSEDSLLAKLLLKPCPNMSAYQWRYIMGFNFEMHGIATAIIERSRTGLPIALYPVSPASLVAHWRGDKLYFTYAHGGIDYSSDDILQIYNTPTGYGTVLSPVYYAKSDLDLEEKCKQMQREYYAGGSVMGKIIKVPSQFTDEQQDKLRAKFDSTKGYKNIVMNERVTVEQIQIPTNDIARLSEAQKWSSAEVARRFNVPLFFLGDSSVTYGNAEQQGLQMAIYCLNPRVKAWEMAFADTICPTGQYIKFSLEGLMRGDHTARSAFYHNAVMDGWMSINEVRGKEDLSPIKDGDVHFFPMNYGSLSDVASGKFANGSSASIWDAPSENRVRMLRPIDEKKAHDRAFIAESTAPALSTRAKLQRLVRAQVKAETAKLKELVATGKPYNIVLKDFIEYLAQHAEEVKPQYKELYLNILKRMLPVITKEVNSDLKVGDDKLDGFADKYSQSMISRQQGRVYKAVSEAETEEELEDATEELADSLPAETADEEVHRSANAFSVFLYANLGVKYMHIVSSYDACPFCSKLDGKVCEVDGYVLKKDSDEDDGDGGVRHIKKNYKHPPFHTHCTCGVAPGK